MFGADDRDGDVITDFNAAEQSIPTEDGAVMRWVVGRNGNQIITLHGDRDTIAVRNADLDIEDSFAFSHGLLVA